MTNKSSSEDHVYVTLHMVTQLSADKRYLGEQGEAVRPADMCREHVWWEMPRSDEPSLM